MDPYDSTTPYNNEVTNRHANDKITRNDGSASLDLLQPISNDAMLSGAYSHPLEEEGTKNHQAAEGGRTSSNKESKCDSAASLGPIQSSKAGEGGLTDSIEEDSSTDLAALLVFAYLAFISVVIVGAIVMCFFVVASYGFFVFLLIVVFAGAVAVVAATTASVIANDRKLEKARSQIKDWHKTVHKVFVEEIRNFKEDLTESGLLLLLMDGDAGAREAGAEEAGAGEANNREQDVDTGGYDGSVMEGPLEGNEDFSNGIKEKRRKPKSVIFRVIVAPFMPSSKKGLNGRTTRSWRRKKQSKSSSYIPPIV